MRGVTKNRLMAFLLICTCCLVMHVDIFGADNLGASDRKRVLFISSYSYAWETVPEQIDGIQEAFGDDVELEYKFMDTKNVTSKKGEQLFYESMKEYLNQAVPFHAVIVGDDAALLFVKKYRQELFKGLPIVFEGINDPKEAFDAAENMQMTGILENLSYESTIELAVQLCPKATKIVAILDNSVTGEGERKSFYSHEKDFPGLQFLELNAEEYTREELKEKVAAYGDDTILLYVMCSQDKNGQAYTCRDACEMISASAHIPVFTIVSIGMGSGVLGGEVVSQKQMGYLAANMLELHFAGKPFIEFHVQKNPPRTFIFDENVLKKYDIKKSKLPKGFDIVNHEETFLEKNGKVLKFTGIAGVFLFLLMFVLVRDNVRRRKLNETMREAKDSMEHAARFDTLTGLKNRLVFSEELEYKISADDTIGLILFDIDGFKQINDTLGHNNGDVVLKELAKRVSSHEDENFQVYRLAGDEFTAIISARDTDVAYAYAKEIQRCFKKPFKLENNEYTLHSSIGVAMYPVDGATSKELIAAADEAMYHVKRNGKNSIAFYEDV